jgi:sugar lactone lactonase YvrE
MKAEPALDAKAMLGEGSLWDWKEQKLLWIDILGHELHRFDPATGSDECYRLKQPIGTAVPRHTGEIVVALHDGVYTINLVTGEMNLISDVEAGIQGNRFNDGKCDPSGRFWVGTVSFNCDIPGAGSLYRIDKELNAVTILDNLTIPNGICWASKTHKMYYIDSPTHEIWQFDYDPMLGNVDNKKVLITIPENQGIPDGMTIDAEDNLWVAQFGGSRVSCFSTETGQKLDEVLLPVRYVTSCAFGGFELDTLYITTARLDMPDDEIVSNQPLAGGLFCIKPGVQGVRAAYFEG